MKFSFVTYTQQRNGSYTWTQDANVTGKMDTYIFEMQFCGPVTNSPYKACDSLSAVNLILQSNTSNCMSLGDGTLYSVNENPSSHNGLFMAYYHGTYINQITALNSKIFIECNQTVGTLTTPYLEHFTKGNSYIRECIDPNDSRDLYLGGQFHFRANSKYVCPK